ncbi:MAG: serine/threonine-protein kinase [Myxococcota bacterium]
MGGPPQLHANLAGQKIADRYLLEDLIGAGAMGQVWRARCTDDDRTVAIKLVLPDPSSSAPVIGRFKSEALAASRLNHPNTVEVVDFGETADGWLYLVMEYLRGQNLDTLLRRTGRLSEQRSLAIISMVLDALIVAHQNNIIHRDLKPANIMLLQKSGGTEHVKVLDFGIAKVLDPVGPDDPTGMLTVTRAGTVVGTPAYMAPEQAAGKSVDPRSDVYSAGVTLYHMVTGQKPFRSKNLVGLLQQVIEAPPPPVSSRLSTVDRRVEAVIHTAMQKDPRRRFASARAMKEAIQGIVDAGERTLHSSITGAGDSHPTVQLTDGAPPPQEVSMASGAHGSVSASMHSVGGLTLPYATGTFEAPPKELSLRRLFGGALVLALVFAGGAMLVGRFLNPGPSLAELERRVELKAWGAGESYALENYELFSSDPAAGPLVRQLMAMRRQAIKNAEKDLGVAHNPDVVVEPGTWRGEAVFPNRPERFLFTYVLESVDGHAVKGYVDWPGIGVRARLVGYVDGNHLVLWDSAFLLNERSSMAYTLYDKKSLFIDGDRLVGLDGPYRVRWEARRQDL